MLIKQPELKQMFLDTADLWKKNSAYLSEIDSRFGDGDHGVTINKIALLIEREVELWSEKSIEQFISDLGSGIMGINGGSAGPLYGTMVGGLADPLDDIDTIDGPLLKKMLRASLTDMQDISKAKVGDKTMMDSLIPAVEAAEQAGDSVEEVLKAAVKAAVQGSKDSEQYISRFGRARSYKEQTIGTPDAGAVSTALFFEGLSKIIYNCA